MAGRKADSFHNRFKRFFDIVYANLLGHKSKKVTLGVVQILRYHVGGGNQMITLDNMGKGVDQ